MEDGTDLETKEKCKEETWRGKRERGTAREKWKGETRKLEWLKVEKVGISAKVERVEKSGKSGNK